MRKDNENVYKTLREKGLSVKDLARGIGKTPMGVYGTINKYNTNKESQEEIAEYLGKSVEYLFGEEEN